MLSTSFKLPAEIFSLPSKWIPGILTFSNYIRTLRWSFILRCIMNSLIISTSSTIISLIIAIHAAYGFARFNFAGKRIGLLLILSSRILPRVAIIIPLFLIMGRLALVDTYRGLIILYIAISMPISVWLLVAFFKDLPLELEEAARLDGCSRLGALWRIILPISMPVVFATGIYCFILAWNEFMLALIFTDTLHARPITVGMSFYIKECIIDWGGLMACSVLVTIPPMVVFLFLQRYFVKGLTTGALKG